MKKLAEKVKPFYKSRTIWFGFILAIIPWVDSLRNYTTDPKTMALIGIIVITLRFLTKDAIVSQ